MNWQNYKLIVQTSKNSKAILRYLDKNINTINKIGIIIRIDKISSNEMDDATIEAFKKRGITRFPVLLGNDNAKYVGLNEIIELFEVKLNRTKAVSRLNPANDTYNESLDPAGSEDILRDFYSKEMFNRDGTRRNDDEEDVMGEPKSDIQKRMSEYDRNKPDRHRTGAQTDNFGANRPQHRPQNRQDPDELINNIYQEDLQIERREPPIKIGKLDSSGDPQGDILDQRMLDVWADNL